MTPIPSLTKENFFNELYEKYPKGLQVFCDWIDKYKKSVNWNILFNDDVKYPNPNPNVPPSHFRTKAPKFHDLPHAMQLGIWLEFVNESGTESPEYYITPLYYDLKEHMNQIFSYLQTTDSEVNLNHDIIKLSDCPVPILQNEHEFNQFMDIYRKHRPKKVLEIGSLFGGTLYYFLKNAALTHLMSIDLLIPEYDERYEQMKTIRDIWGQWMLPNLYFHDVRLNSRSGAAIHQAELFFPRKDVDLLHIDGDHSYEGVRADYNNYKPFVREGGLIVFHDITGIPEVKQFWQELIAEKKKEKKRIWEITTSTPHGWGIGIIEN